VSGIKCESDIAFLGLWLEFLMPDCTRTPADHTQFIFLCR
jgi:hypothetical protein